MYHKITKEEIEHFQSAMPGRVLWGTDITEDYGHDEMENVHHMPDVLIRVESTKEVSSIMSFANQQGIPVVVRGSGTGLVGGAVAVEGGILMETTLMNRILELDAQNLTVTVQPGVLLMDLAEYVESNDLFYPPDPGEKAATVGGNISTNAGGMRAVKYGVTRDYVMGLTVVLPSGEIVNLDGKVAKNSSGYSLKNLIIGSEGTLGVITEAVLRLLPLPRYSISLLVPFRNMESALKIVPEVMKSKIIPTAIEYLPRETILYAEEYLGKRFPDTESDSYILFSFDGNTKQSVMEDMENVAKLCLSRGAEDAFIVDTDERKKSVWNARGAFLEAIKASTPLMDECDVVVPKDQIAAFIRFTVKLSAQYGVRIPSFGHAGDGNLHIYICKDGLEETKWDYILAEIFRNLYQKANELHGLVSGEHGIGWAKRNYLWEQCGDTQMNLMIGIKEVFDPNAILNPKKIVSSRRKRIQVDHETQ